MTIDLSGKKYILAVIDEANDNLEINIDGSYLDVSLMLEILFEDILREGKDKGQLAFKIYLIKNALLKAEKKVRTKERK